MQQPNLSQAQLGAQVRLIAVDGDAALKKRLLSLGLSIGCSIEVVQRRGSGVVVGKGSHRIALGHTIAKHILTETAV